MSPAVVDILTPLWRGVVAVRTLAAALVAGALLAGLGGVPDRAPALVLLGGIVLWTAVSCAAYSRPATRTTVAVAADLGVTLALLLTSSLLVPAAEQAGADVAGAPLLTTVWAVGPVAAAAVHAGRFAATLCAVAVLAVDVWAHGAVTTGVGRDAVLLATAGLAFGLAATTARRATAHLHRAARAEAATTERERVVHDLHDGVLGALSRIREHRPDAAAELSRAATEQEIALRALVSRAPGAQQAGEQDLAAALRDLAGPRVEVSAPATGIALPGAEVAELVDITREAIAAASARAAATSWVLVEERGAEIVLAVRVDGRAGPAEPSRALRDRVADLGAVLTLDALDADSARGAEWRIHLTRPRRELLR